MTAAGDAVLGYAYTQLGVVESPANSNCVEYWAPWTGGNPCGFGAWCAAFVSYCHAAVGYPLPAIDGAPGFSYCPSGQIYGFTYDGSNVDPQAGDTLIFSWEPFYYGNDGIAYCSSGVYAGAPAGDHTGFFVEWLGSDYMRTIEGNTSQSSWDDGGAVLERTDRYSGQICCYWRPAPIQGGSSGPGPVTDEGDDTVYQPLLVITDGSPWKGSVFLCAGGFAVGISDESILTNMQARGYCKPVIEVNEWDITGAYQVVYPSGPGAVPR